MENRPDDDGRQVAQLRALASEINGLRPDWEWSGILNHLAPHRDRPLADLTAAAHAAAANTSARTPAAIAWPSHWPKPAPAEPVIGPPALGPLPECARCGQPARRDDRPEHCPQCGQPWHPHQHQDDQHAALRTRCPRCHHEQRRGFPHCTNCGGRMFNSGQLPPPRPLIPERPRLTAIDDPAPIASVMDELA